MRFSRLYKEKRLDNIISLYQTYAFNMVGMTGFEPAASSSLRKRDTKLRYIPIKKYNSKDNK